MSKPLTDRQIRYRQYLQSPIWAAKRQEALDHYGCVCGRCKGYGTDVHHRTYARVGGKERIGDLEVLCRPCHEAHHAAERCAAKPRRGKAKTKGRSINRAALYRLLTSVQRTQIGSAFGVTQAQLYCELMDGTNEALLTEACRMLGADTYYPKVVRRRHKARGRGYKHPSSRPLRV